jgi:hypothetical protein
VDTGEQRRGARAATTSLAPAAEGSPYKVRASIGGWCPRMVTPSRSDAHPGDSSVRVHRGSCGGKSGVDEPSPCGLAAILDGGDGGGVWVEAKPNMSKRYAPI